MLVIKIQSRSSSRFEGPQNNKPPITPYHNKIPNNFIKWERKNNLDDNSTYVSINPIPILPTRPMNIAFLLMV
jgi:hypothetical protein